MLMKKLLLLFAAASFAAIPMTAQTGSTVREDCVWNYSLISTGGILKIIAINQIYCGSGLRISNGGQSMLKSMKNIDLNGGVVEKDGVLEMDGETVNLESGFSVEKGGCLFINI